MKRILLLLAILFLAGCSSATYRHPVTGQVGVCTQAGPDVYSLGSYASCKTAYERAGFARVDE